MTRIEKMLAKLEKDFGRNFNKIADNRWTISTFPSPKRHQIVYLRVDEKKEGTKDTSRFVCTSPIGLADGVDFEWLLRKNLTLDIGTIAIEDLKNKDGDRIAFLIFKASHITSTADHLEIWELVTKTGMYADQLERELSDIDRF